MGIVDGDFWHLEGVGTPSANLLITDFHDAEMLVIVSTALGRVIRELGSAEKIARFRALHGGKPLVRILLEIAAPLGALRWASEREGWRLDFNVRLDRARCIEPRHLNLDFGRWVEVVLQVSGSALRRRRVHEVVSSLLSEQPDLRQLCSGHDIVAIMSVGLRRAIGSRRMAGALPDVLEEGLRMAYDSKDFRKTSLYASARAWEARNPPYQLFDA
ncbi:MAG: DUF4435 domain-containing protein [Actinomycetota bacterium]|nr:DUF4435 domain-containing protein [Actinomycetota bacterium]